MDTFWKDFGNENSLSQFFDSMPYLVMVLNPNGKAIFVNQAFIENMNISNRENLLNNYNIYKDGCALAVPGMEQFLNDILSGKVSKLENIKTPSDGFMNYTKEGHSVNEFVRQNLTGFPIYDNNKEIIFVVIVSNITMAFKGKSEIVKVQEYLATHWKKEFDIAKLEDIANLSARQLSRTFKNDTGETPFAYYQRLKIEKLKETLDDPNLNVEQAFKACGLEYNGMYARHFKSVVGMSPLEYKKQIKK
ncbi:MAG: helix-turn-helix domain-containing protein [Firmicutes bacterium]|nr:helix-turn-helix domain-containing protein [Bacillota bacterium]